MEFAEVVIPATIAYAAMRRTRGFKPTWRAIKGIGQAERDSSGQYLARWVSASFYLEMTV
jgi:hypothetical protein